MNNSKVIILWTSTVRPFSVFLNRSVSPCVLHIPRLLPFLPSFFPFHSPTFGEHFYPPSYPDMNLAQHGMGKKEKAKERRQLLPPAVTATAIVAWCTFKFSTTIIHVRTDLRLCLFSEKYPNTEGRKGSYPTAKFARKRLLISKGSFINKSKLWYIGRLPGLLVKSLGHSDLRISRRLDLSLSVSAWTWVRALLQYSRLYPFRSFYLANTAVVYILDWVLY